VIAITSESVIGFAGIRIVERNLRDIVLVGHSYAGTLIARLAEEIPDRIRRLVFWNAFVPQRGNCLIDEVPPHYRTLFDELAAASSDGTIMLPYPIWREVFINDADETYVQVVNIMGFAVHIERRRFRVAAEPDGSVLVRHASKRDELPQEEASRE
jgi:pimeloyl-ACP methyl ester carboxylesterase